MAKSMAPAIKATDLLKQKKWNEAVIWCKVASKSEYLKQEPTEFQRTPLHVALTVKPPIFVIKAFVEHECFKEACLIRDTYCGYLPIHCAIRYQASSGLVSKLVNSMPAKLLEVGDQSSMTPLHIECNFRSNSQMIRILVDANPQTLKMLTKDGKSPLLLSCSHKKPLDAVKILLGYPESKQVNMNPNRKCSWTPLHMACLHNAPIEAIKMLAEANPIACIQKTCSNQTPLGIYFFSFHNLSQEVVTCLVNPDRGYSYPGIIHQVLAFSQYQFIPGLLEYCIQHFPEHAEMRREDGQLPLHVAIQNASRPKGDQRKHNAENYQAWEQILDCYQGAIRVVDDENIYPFMLASSFSCLEISFKLLSFAPDIIGTAVRL